MSLIDYVKDKRIVILDAGTSAYDAVRALEHNHIGAVLVNRDGRLAGIITDRDLARRVIGFELNPKETLLRDVMTPEPATVTLRDTEESAAKLMRASHVRRLPIVDDDGRAIGIVTLDDFVVKGAVDPYLLGEIIDAQLSEPAPAKPAGVTHPTRTSALAANRAQRSAARAQQTLQAFTSRLRELLELDDPSRARTAFEIVASNLVRRVNPDEAKDFASQLPSLLRDELLELPPGPDRNVTLESIVVEMAERLELDPAGAVSLVARVGAALREFVSPEEVEQLKSQLPTPMKVILSGASPESLATDRRSNDPMPEERTKRRAQKAKAEGKSPTTQAGEFVREEIHHVREGKHGARNTKQAIAIGLSKARRSGVDVPPPAPGRAPERTRASAERDLERGKEASRSRSSSPRRSRASLRRLKREGRGAASRQALARQAHSAASRRTRRERSASARKAARTKGARGRRTAAQKAARTRARS